MAALTVVLTPGSPGRGEFGQDVPEILYPSVLSPVWRDSEVFRRSLTLARHLLGPGTWFRFDHSIRKPPGRAYETVWHQDRVHKRSGLPERRLNSWIPTSPVGAEDGCMRYVPGSHLGGVLPHDVVPDRRGALRTAGVDETAAVDCPLPVGGAAPHLFETVHSVHPNLGDRPRTAWILQFTRPPGVCARRRTASPSGPSFPSKPWAGAYRTSATSPSAKP